MKSPRELALRVSKVADPFIGRGLAVLPDRLKYGKDYLATRARLSAMKTDGQLAAAVQADMLGAALRDAGQSTFWSTILARRAHTNPYEALHAMPVLSRSVLTEAYSDMITMPIPKLELMSTSGSGGEPVSFYLPRDRRPTEWAYVTNSWAQAGYANSDWRVVFRGFPPTSATGVAVHHALREVRVTTMRNSEDTYAEVARQMKRHSIRYLHGYPSALATFSPWLANSHNALSCSIRGVFPVSEKLEQERFIVLRDSLPHAVIVPFYGLSEKSAFAVCDDPEKGTYSFEPTYGYVEILDDHDNPVSEGQSGRVVTTRLEFPGAPLFRYDTGDVARVVQNQSLEAGHRLVVTDLSPRRSVSYLLSADGREVPTSPGIQAGSTFFKNDIAEYQLVQKIAGQVTFFYVPRNPHGSKFEDALKGELQSKLGDGFTVRVESVESIPKGANGKVPLVVRRFNV